MLTLTIIIGYTYVSWKFFKERIPYEEKTLMERFKEYKKYKAESYVGIPFI
jgi:protein-S-isoprenylcysteine O-methyltransferase Ste14